MIKPASIKCLSWICHPLPQNPFQLLKWIRLQMSTPAPPSSIAATNFLSNLGLGYSITVALVFLVLLSTLLLASYACCRCSSRPAAPDHTPSDGIVLPRIIFVAEDLTSDVVSGLDPVVINSYPKSQFRKEAAGGGEDATCSICLCEYREAEMVRMMPECRHYFHVLCIDAWLKLNGSCPVCRNSPLPTPISTPLQEVTPLSQYAADRRRRMW